MFSSISVMDDDFVTMQLANSMSDIVEFSGDLTIRTIKDAYEKLSLAIADNSKTVLSVAEDATVDLIFIQLIEAGRRAAREAGRELALAAPAQGSLLETLRRGGFLEAADHRQFWLTGSGIH
jgi:hypothetical protein